MGQHMADLKTTWLKNWVEKMGDFKSYSSGKVIVFFN